MALVVEKNFKIMASLFASVDSEVKEINQSYQVIMDKITSTRRVFLPQVEEGDTADTKNESGMGFLNGTNRYIKTCIVTGNEQADQTLEAWTLFRKLLCTVVSKHRNIDLF